MLGALVGAQVRARVTVRSPIPNPSLTSPYIPYNNPFLPVGAQVGARAIPDELKRGLRHHAEIEHEIARFVEARIGKVEACAA